MKGTLTIQPDKPGVQAMLDEFRRLDDELGPLETDLSHARTTYHNLQGRVGEFNQAKQHIIKAIAALHGDDFQSLGSRTTREEFTKLVEQEIGRPRPQRAQECDDGD